MDIKKLIIEMVHSKAAKQNQINEDMYTDLVKPFDTTLPPIKEAPDMTNYGGDAPLDEEPKDAADVPREKGLDPELEEDDVDDQDSGDADRFEEIINEIASLTEEAYNLIPRKGMTRERARQYWRGHIQGALGTSHSEYMGGSMFTMEDTLEEMRGGSNESKKENK